MGLNSNSLDAKSLRHAQNDSESHTWREERDKERDMSVSVRLILRGYYILHMIREALVELLLLSI